MKPRDDKKIDEIYKATLRLVKQKGLAGITMNEIAKEAKIATGTLYIYFKNKNELINALFMVCRNRSAAVYFKNYDASMPFKAGLKIIWRNLLNYRVKKFEEAVFVDQCFHSPFITETTRELTKKLFAPLFSLMESGKKQKLIKNTDTLLLLTFMAGSINETVKYAHYSNKKLSKEVVEQMFHMCWDGLKA
ncbi:MAG: TetR/AcrR family transcriptional regulator [Parafilimonas sp.]|nr:TetR/AcrR family transcriptional regulator [Parafilimonas sp.]